MQEAVEKLIRALVGDPDAVAIEEYADGKNVRFEVRVGEGDMGRVIGREGRTVKAIRNVFYAAGQKRGCRYFLDLVED
ncbi:MAG: KH domain-containing protein [Acidobacteriota bacterium]|nr:MAG: KH domain-containing protein [Acidobacteriota bacterium]